MPRVKRILGGALLAGLGTLALGATLLNVRARYRADELRAIEADLAKGRYQPALARCEAFLDGDASPGLLRHAAHAALGAGLHEQARRYLESAYAKDPAGTAAWACKRAHPFVSEGRARAAAILLAFASRHTETAGDALGLMATLALDRGRYDRARMLIYHRLRFRRYETEHLLFLAKGRPVRLTKNVSPKPPGSCQTSELVLATGGLVPASKSQSAITRPGEATDDEAASVESAAPPSPFLRRIHAAIAAGDWEGAREAFESAERPPRPGDESYGLWGWILVRSADGDAFDRWWQALPEGCPQSAWGWRAVGEALRKRGDTQRALRAYWESLRVHPDHGPTLAQIAQLCDELGLPEAAAYRRREAEVRALAELAREVRNGGSAASVHAMAAQCERMGGLWEAWAWYTEFAQRAPADVTIREDLRRVARYLGDDLPPIAEAADVAARHRLDRFPKPHPPAVSPQE